MPIFIRCLGHLWGDGKFGQIGHPVDLAEAGGGGGLSQAGIRRPGDGATCPGSADHRAAGQDRSGWFQSLDAYVPAFSLSLVDAVTREVITRSAAAARGTDDSGGRRC
ncbi:hypothetical protein ABZ865_21730 [Streptomyces sp. NPDC047085]|uniref:hypothetical protein n=1 Tax=Streptomyces sp. NPDC047085 TaxID=3155140 RepID=UPI0033DE1717